MGYEAAKWSVSVTLNRHNSWKDQRDNGLWLILQARLREVCDDPMFTDISPMTDGWAE